MVGSYSGTKWFCISWIVRADLPTPPAKNQSFGKLVLSVTVYFIHNMCRIPATDRYNVHGMHSNRDEDPVLSKKTDPGLCT